MDVGTRFIASSLGDASVSGRDLSRPYYFVKIQETPLAVIPRRRPPGEVWKNLCPDLSLCHRVDSSLRSE